MAVLVPSALLMGNGPTPGSPSRVSVVAKGLSKHDREEAQSVADAAFSTTSKLLASNKKSDSELQVHLYSTIDDYERAEQRLTGGRFKTNLAFTHADTKSAHIVIQPPIKCDSSTVQELPGFTRRLLAHEVFHLRCYAESGAYRRMPDWLTDGAASYVDQQVMHDLESAGEPENDPHISTYIYLVKRLIQRKELPSIRAMMNEEFDAFDRSTRYGLCWLLFAFMEDGPRPGSGSRLLREMLRQEGGGEKATKAAQTVRKIKDYFAGKDDQFAKFVSEKNADWNEVFRSLDTSSEDWVQIAFPAKNAVAWRNETLGDGPWTLSGRMRILPCEAKQLNVLCGAAGGSFISVAYVAEYGVTVFHYRAGPKEWETIAKTRTRDVRLGDVVRFRLERQGPRLDVFLDGQHLIATDAPEDALNGNWGLGAQAGSAGIWNAIVVTKKQANDGPGK